MQFLYFLHNQDGFTSSSPANNGVVFVECASFTNIWSTKSKKKKYRRWWVRPCNRLRHVEGAFEKIFLKYKYTDHEMFHSLTRLTVDLFDELLEIIGPHIQKNSYREFLSPEFRLAFTICYLASGNSFPSSANYWQIGKSTAYKIVRETCDAIANILGATYLSPPTQQEYKNIADNFWRRWNLPNCIGALDGKHIRIQCPRNSGSQYFNYKQFFSIVLMATCDANYCITSIHVGDYGSLPDSSVFSATECGQAVENNTLNVPPPSLLPGTDIMMPYFLIGDEIFPLRHNLLRPYSKRNRLTETQRIYNYRHSRPRLVIENAFGILTTRWRILRTTLASFPDSVESIVYATVCLHNFIMKREEHQQGFKRYCPPAYVDQEDNDRHIIPGEWRNDGEAPNIQNLHRVGGNRASAVAINQRDTLADYLANHEQGQVPWQWSVVFRGRNINVPQTYRHIVP